MNATDSAGSIGETGGGHRNVAIDKRIDQLIGILLRTGVLLAATMVAIGGGVFLMRHRLPVADYHTFGSEPRRLTTVRGIVGQALQWHGSGLIQLGLLLLIATPVARVAFSVGAFLYERDWTYVLVSLLVLALLFYSLFSGHG